MMKILKFFIAIIFSGVFGDVIDPRIVEHPEDQYVARNDPATLNCKAEGSPPPIITWHRGGQRVITSSDDPSSHRMLLPTGQLFMLRLMHNKTNPHAQDVGAYYCNATNPQTGQSVLSRTANLMLAVIGSEFREQPSSREVAVGGEAQFDCQPPKGEPRPRISWRKDGEILTATERLRFRENSLNIRDVRRDDAGVYTCVAQNNAGERESAPAKLFIREKPRIIEGPKDVLVREGSNAYFQCRAIGDPEPAIIWKKADDPIPQARLGILEDKSLKIEGVQSSDDGTFICRAENSVGFVESQAKLTVHSFPSFLITPNDKVVGLGRRVILRCEATGNPPPNTFWMKEDTQTLIFPSRESGARVFVSEEGSLVISNVEVGDAGEYSCKALSIVGTAQAKAKLHVIEVDLRPPPIIHEGAQNQTLPLNSDAMLACVGSGEPPPLTTWLHNNKPINNRDHRFVVLDNGSLKISELRKSDAGYYVCRLWSETGETRWGAWLSIEAPTDPAIIFRRTPEPSSFPGPPSRPVVSDITAHSVKLSWKGNSNHGASPVQGYIVEYFTHDTGDGWMIASDKVVGEYFIIEGLLPNTSYMFLVRAFNSHGWSLPSHVTSMYKTKGVSGLLSGGISRSVVEEKLSGSVINLLPLQVLSSTQIKVLWEIRRNEAYIEGIHIKYRAVEEEELQHLNRRQRTKQPPNYNIQTAKAGDGSEYILSGLGAHVLYEVCVQPFHSKINGAESQTLRARTHEDVPASPPVDINVRLIDNSTLHITWQPPPTHMTNGILKGYKIYMFGSEAKFNREIVMNASLDGVYIHNIVRDMPYKIQLAAYTRIGEGVRSPIFNIGGSASSRWRLGGSGWMVGLVIMIVGGAIWLLLCLASLALYRNMNKNKKNLTNQQPNNVAMFYGNCEVPQIGTMNHAPSQRNECVYNDGSTYVETNKLIRENYFTHDDRTRKQPILYIPPPPQHPPPEPHYQDARLAALLPQNSSPPHPASEPSHTATKHHAHPAHLSDSESLPRNHHCSPPSPAPHDNNRLVGGIYGGDSSDYETKYSPAHTDSDNQQHPGDWAGVGSWSSSSVGSAASSDNLSLRRNVRALANIANNFNNMQHGEITRPTPLARRRPAHPSDFDNSLC